MNFFKRRIEKLEETMQPSDFDRESWAELYEILWGHPPADGEVPHLDQDGVDEELRARLQEIFRPREPQEPLPPLPPTPRKR